MAYNGGSDPTLAELITRSFIPVVASKDAFAAVKTNLVCVSAFNTNFRNQLKRGYKVEIPVFTAVSTTEVTPGTEPTAADASTSSTSITVDKWYEASAEISNLMAIEEVADYLKGAIDECSYSVAKTIDTDVNGLFSTLASSSVYGSDGQTFTDDIFIDLVETLDEADVPDDGKRVLIGDPSTRADLLGIDKFVRTDYVRETVPTGKIGMLYNVGCFFTNNLTASTTGAYGVLAHRDAIGIVIQKDLNVKHYDMSYKFIQKIIVDCAWGADEIRDTFGKSFYTRKK